MVTTMKQDITKAIQFSNTFRYIDDLFSANIACENIRFSSLFVAEDVSRETSSATKSEEKRMFSQASANNVDFGNYISAIYSSELELKDTSTSSTEVCYLDTNIKTGDNTPFRISIYDKRVFIYLNW